MTRESAAAHLASVLKVIDHLKHNRAASQTTRDEVCVPAESTLTLLIGSLGYELDEHGNPVDILKLPEPSPVPPEPQPKLPPPEPPPADPPVPEGEPPVPLEPNS